MSFSFLEHFLFLREIFSSSFKELKKHIKALNLGSVNDLTFKSIDSSSLNKSFLCLS